MKETIMPRKRDYDKDPTSPPIATLNLKVLAEASKFASTEDHRLSIRGVQVEIDPAGVTYIATDGRRLIAHRVESLGDSRNTLTGAFTIPTAQCRILKAPKELDSGWAELTWASKMLTLRFWDVGISFYPIFDEFPAWRRVIPSGYASGVAGQFSGEQLASFAKFADALDLTSPYVRHDGEGNAARIVFQSSPDTIGVLTAISANSPAWPTPSWVELRPAEAYPDPSIANAMAADENTETLRKGIFEMANG